MSDWRKGEDTRSLVWNEREPKDRSVRRRTCKFVEDDDRNVLYVRHGARDDVERCLMRDAGTYM